MLTTNSKEIPVSFLCGEHQLYGILHQPAQLRERGVLMVAGRPALRAGRHRLFVLLARAWAEAGIPVMRFDFRGTGDSEGEMGTLEESCDDIRSAVDAFISHVPALQQVVLWGLCGGAADSILYAPRDSRVTGIVLTNPWSYDVRILTLAKWRREISLCSSNLVNWFRLARRRIARFGEATLGTASSASAPTEDLEPQQVENFDMAAGPDAGSSGGTSAVRRAYCSYRVPDLSRRLAANLEEFKGHVLFIFSGRDPGAQAFKRTASISLRWRRLLLAPRVQTRNLPEANHSLRRPEWRAQAAAWTLGWLQTF
jgi:uncharacterized protein